MKWRRRAGSGAPGDGRDPGGTSGPGGTSDPPGAGDPPGTGDADGTGDPADPADAGLKLRVGELFAEAQLLMLQGRPAEGVAPQQEARRLMYGLIERNPGDRAAKEMLGNVLYGLGSTLTSADEPGRAIDALTECAAVYGELAVPAGPGGDAVSGGPDPSAMVPLLADVHARKAHALSALGHGASAVVESDEAVMAYLGLGAEATDSPHRLDLARVLSLNASVLHSFGDRDLAACSADWAVRYYLARAEAINTGPLVESLMHGGYLRTAAGVAARVHTEQGRLSIALGAGATEVHSARALAESDSSADLGHLASALTRHGLNLRVAGRTAEGNELIREARGIDPAAEAGATREWQSLTGRSPEQGGRRPVTCYSAAIAVATRVLGESEVPSVLRDLAFDPSDGATTVTPSLLCEPGTAPALATLLAEAALGLLRDARPDSRDAAGVLGIQAHCLFAAASRVRATAMRDRFHESGGTWARLLLALIPLYENGASPATGEDLRGGLADIVLRLQPFAHRDEATRRLVEECTAFIGRGPR
ncbi:hypothetical protein [Streptomyces griseiscabiei]|uniref:Uncharacterized protein n=1 Tax=Streptomyces griseiscabiei TaxID=2993540 RepID=A0ABU4LDD5_9ACTN|nr:hypothetical protein [Streptomyces griseiscabiei]MBZ3906701.1 hypothetical protein [Streptomyces griseiscabiei]MDX2913766.1 hypothetical protein [Streptomyces griseiscabiei]